jgi:nitrile hydratase accessory protein
MPIDTASAACATQAVPSIPRDENGPVFRQPWEARAFALALSLNEVGLFTWTEWADVLGQEIKVAQASGDPDTGVTYYRHWLAALERIVAAKGVQQIALHMARPLNWRRQISVPERTCAMAPPTVCPGLPQQRLASPRPTKRPPSAERFKWKRLRTATSRRLANLKHMQLSGLPRSATLAMPQARAIGRHCHGRPWPDPRVTATANLERHGRSRWRHRDSRRKTGSYRSRM